MFRQIKARHADPVVRHPAIQVEAALRAEIIAPVVAGREDDIGNGRRTLRKLYATPWKPWTLVETLDKKTGQRFKKA